MTIKAFIEPGSHITLHLGERRSLDCYKAFGESVQNWGTCPSINVPDGIHLGSIPEELATVVRFWSVQENFLIDGSNSNIRAIGKYHLGKATAEVETYDGGQRQSIHITGSDLAECMRLRDLIRSGEIAPAKRYDQPQVKSTVASVRECAHQLIESLALAFDRIWHRLCRRA